jgi:Heme/copper-type cytochrome/quinol oxidase, subunit 3
MHEGYAPVAPRSSQNIRNPLFGVYCLLVAQGLTFLGFCTVFLFFLLTGRGWHPGGRPPIDIVAPTINMIVLLVSSVTMRWAGLSLRHNKLGRTKLALLLTLILGGIFLADQIYSFFRIGLASGSSIFIAVFYILIIFHAVHTVAGLIFLGITLNRTQAGDFSPVRHVGFDACELFWHFVAWIWAVLYVLLFVF